MAPNTGVVPPDMAVVPENVTVLEVSVDPALLTKFPFNAMAFDPASNDPPVRVRIPLTVIALARETVPLLLTVKLFNAVVEEGNSSPVEPVPV